MQKNMSEHSTFMEYFYFQAFIEAYYINLHSFIFASIFLLHYTKEMIISTGVRLVLILS